jgi:hypothetical protein
VLDAHSERPAGGAPTATSNVGSPVVAYPTRPIEWRTQAPREVRRTGVRVSSSWGWTASRAPFSRSGKGTIPSLCKVHSAHNFRDSPA